MITVGDKITQIRNFFTFVSQKYRSHI